MTLALASHPGADPLSELRADLESDWLLWLATLLPNYCTAPFGAHHEEFWRWVWAMVPGQRPDPYIAIWGRGGAKSTSAEAACVAIGARRIRRYGLYVSGIQEKADDHVANVGSILESPAIETFYPEMASRLVGKYGNSKGWKRNRLRTQHGFTIDALGLDAAARGAKLDDARPDFIVFDDIDEETDSLATVEKKVKQLTRKVLPAGARDVAILGVQNLVHPESVFARLAGSAATPADFLATRTVSGPIPAIRGMEYVQDEHGRFVITGGTASWAGQDLQTCQENIDDWGFSAFMSEAQHEVGAPPGGLYSHLTWRRCTHAEVPALRRIVVWVDPAVTDKDTSDSHAIQADGIGIDGTIYRLYSWEGRTSPLDSLKRAIRKAIELGAEKVGVETDQGGDTWQVVYRQALGEVLAEIEGADPLATYRTPKFDEDKAGSGHGGKVERSNKMLADYERGRIVHVEGTTDALERGLYRFPKTKPFDLADAAYWSWADLRSKAGRLRVR
jgi:hypothetical protein